MRLLITSDLHYDICPHNKFFIKKLPSMVENLNLDAFLLCGDISPFLNDYQKVLKLLSPIKCPKLIVPGNHDVWIIEREKENYTNWEKFDILKELTEEAGFIWMHNNHHIIDNIGFCGSLGWYDYSLRITMHEIPMIQYWAKVFVSNGNRTVWGDVNYIDFNIPDIKVEEKFEKEMNSEISKLEGKGIKKIVVMTHQVPFRNAIKQTGDKHRDFLCAFMGSEKMGDVYLSHDSVKLACFGHTHYPNDFEVSQIRAISSPVGYLYRSSESGINQTILNEGHMENINWNELANRKLSLIEL